MGFYRVLATSAAGAALGLGLLTAPAQAAPGEDASQAATSTAPQAFRGVVQQAPPAPDVWGQCLFAPEGSLEIHYYRGGSAMDCVSGSGVMSLIGIKFVDEVHTKNNVGTFTVGEPGRPIYSVHFGKNQVLKFPRTAELRSLKMNY